ncbi:hypothetical protein EDB99_107131 [Pseudomonas sp. 460]|nr:hypothetical protein EDB99_107131 [Pseudomonas sp. 460]
MGGQVPTGEPLGPPVNHPQARGLSIGAGMRKFKLTASQSVCLALAVIGLTLAVYGGRTYLWILIPISIGICMPFYSLVNTGYFTYYPPEKSIEVTTPKTKQLTSPTQPDREVKTSDTKQKDYDLRDIPYPPKRKGQQPITSLPHGKGLSPQKKTTKVSNQRCALLGPKPTTLSGARSPEPPIGTTLSLFNNADSPSTQEPEEIFVKQDCIFL